MYKAILFDLDGTLIDSSEGITKCVQYALDKFDIHEDNLDKLRPFIGPPLRNSFAKYYDFDKEQAEEATRIYRERYTPIGIFECSLYPNVRECIEALKEKGYVIGLASSKPEDMCHTVLKHFDILDLFDEVVGATHDGRIDTKKQVLDELFRRWSSYSKDEMVLIGDTMFDIEGANQAGIDSIAVSFGFGDVTEMKAAGAKAVVDDLMDLIEVL